MRRALVLMAVGLLGLSACGGGGSSMPQKPPATASVNRTLSSTIQHVVVIVQENRSFDNMFNGYPGADSAQAGVGPDGSTISLAAYPMAGGCDPGHNHATFVAEYDGGKMDNFNTAGVELRVTPNCIPPVNYTYSYVQQSDVQSYWNMAQQYVLADRMFMSNSGPSFVAHQYMIAGQSDMVAENPSRVPWGCNAPVGTTTLQLDSNGNEVTGPYPCFSYATLAGSLDAANASWKYYAPAPSDIGYLVWSAFSAIDPVYNGPDWAKVVTPETTVLTDIANNALPNVAWVMPDFQNSDHPGVAANTGPAWISSIVNAIGQSPYWNSTAILVVWDDWGGWFDHVSPPQLDVMGLGFRIPLLLISPWTRHGYVSHAQHEMASIPKLIESIWNLPAMSAADSRADAFADCFDFTQTPAPFRVFAAKRRAADFLREAPSPHPPDDD